MAKARRISATFSNGHTITRTTTNPNLAFAWFVRVRVPWSRCPETGKLLHDVPHEFEASGFSSKLPWARRAAEGMVYRKEGQEAVFNEVVAIVECR